jgi:hypothetical protein
MKPITQNMSTNPTSLLPILVLVIIASGCAEMHRPVTPVMATAEYAARDPVPTSLFPSDQMVLSDDAVARILSSKLELPPKAKLAIMRFPDAEQGRYYWRNEQYLKLQEAQIDTLTKALLASDQIAEVTPLPSLMVPRQLSLPILREAAVRMQCDLLLVYRVGSDTYSQYRAFSKDRVKAYSTCEMVLLDVRTGLVPLTRVVSREKTEAKLSTDFDLTETMQRAEDESAADALNAGAEDLVAFIKTIPKKSD